MGVRENIARWWQGRGFGIQSKADYEYLKDVIMESLPYYAYDAIHERRARLIYRICNHDRQRHIAMVGAFTPEELRAATMAIGTQPEMVTTMHHLHGRETVIVNDIGETAAPLWDRALHSPNAITWDMGSMGLIRFIDGRYSEHYRV